MDSSVIHRTKSNNLNQFARLIESMENRYMDVSSDTVLDLNSLKVVRTRSGRVSKPRISSQPNSSRKSKKDKTSSSKAARFTALPSPSPSPSPSTCESSSGFESGSYDSVSSNEKRSILFNRALQTESSKNLLQILKKGGPVGKMTTANLANKLKRTLGREELPNRVGVQPFFTFHDDHDIGTTFLFDTPALTPWTLICLQFFGEENLRLYSQMYQYVLAGDATKEGPDFPKTMLNTNGTLNKAIKSSSEGQLLDYVAMPIHNLPMDSLVYQNEHQLSAIRKLAEILRHHNEESELVKKKLRARAVRALASDWMPSSNCENVYPFFSWHEKGEIGVSFLYDIKNLSPWMTICKLYFGDEMISACKDVYRMINQPHTVSFRKLEQLSNSSLPLHLLPPAARSLVNAITEIYTDRSKKTKQPSMSTPISTSSKKNSPLAINNTAPTLRRPPIFSSQSPENSDCEPKRARMSCPAIKGKVGGPRIRKSAITVQFEAENNYPTDIALVSPNLRRTRRSTTIMIDKGFSDPGLALTRQGRKSRIPYRNNSLHHF